MGPIARCFAFVAKVAIGIEGDIGRELVVRSSECCRSKWLEDCVHGCLSPSREAHYGDARCIDFRVRCEQFEGEIRIKQMRDGMREVRLISVDRRADPTSREAVQHKRGDPDRVESPCPRALALVRYPPGAVQQDDGRALSLPLER